MSTDAVEKVTSAGATGSADHAALLFELENVATDGLQVRLAVAKSLIEKAGGTFNQLYFIRHALHNRPEISAAGLIQSCGAKGIDAATFAAKVREGVASKLASHASLAPGLEKLIRAASSRGMAVGTISALPEAVATALMSQLGLDDLGVKLQVVKEDDDKTFPRADLWIKLVRSLGKAPRASLVVVASRLGCKSALAAGTRCLAVPHALCGHEDYGGADLIMDAWDEVSSKEILDVTVPAK